MIIDISSYATTNAFKKRREQQVQSSGSMEHHSRKRKHSDCSERKSCSDRHMDVESSTLRHRRKNFKSSTSSSESSLELETKKKSKKKKEKKSRKHSKKSKKHKKKKKLKAKPKESEEISEDCKLSGKKDFKFKRSQSARLQSGLEPGPMHNKDVREVSQPAPKKSSMAPMTKEEYEKQQSVVRRVYDPETGRHRLVKGDGEIIEEIVSQQRHREINKTATKGDGAFFQAVLGFSDK